MRSNPFPPDENKADAVPRSVFIVDDESDTREMFAALLGAYGYPVERARNADEAITALHQHDDPVPRAILLDLAMPGSDGAAFRREQLIDPRLAGIPVVVVSVRHDAKFVAREMGAVGCVQKPVDFEELLKLLNRIDEDRQPSSN